MLIATGGLFANEKHHSRLLFYAMILQNPFPKNAAVPIVEYISSRHTSESIALMFPKLTEREKDVFRSNIVSPDYGIAIINARL